MALADKRLFLLDMDGTLYLDDRLFDKVPEFLSHVRRIGGRYLFLTNNSSRGVEGYMEKLSRMGIPTAPEDYLTSVDAAIDHLRRFHAGEKCYVFGTRAFYGQLQTAGIPVTDRPEDDVDILLYPCLFAWTESDSSSVMGLFALMESSGSAHNFLDHNVVSCPGIEWPEPIDWTPPDV